MANNKPAVLPAKRRHLYSLTAAAETLSISVSKLYMMVNAGEIQTVRLGGRRMITDQELTRLVAGLKQ